MAQATEKKKKREKKRRSCSPAGGEKCSDELENPLSSLTAGRQARNPEIRPELDKRRRAFSTDLLFLPPMRRYVNSVISDESGRLRGKEK